ncbi:hypothetical protein ACFW9O_25070 [Streptomyces sp. NPDC059499]
MIFLFLAATCFGLAGLCSVALRDVRAVTATLALITALAAIAAAIPH